MDRDSRDHDRAAPLVGEADTPRATDQADGGVRFTNAGLIPPVMHGFDAGAPTASERAYGPGLTSVKQLYERETPTPEHVGRVVMKFPNEQDAIFAWITSAVGQAAADAVRSAIAIIKRDAKNQPHLAEGGLSLHELAPKVAPTFPTKTNDDYENYQNRFKAEQQRNQDRALDPNKDKPHNPIGDDFERRKDGAPPKSKAQEEAEAKLTNALHPPDAGTQIEIRKKLE